ncbi:hypothetical protein ABFT23_17870 [Nocardioides sp. C4-1]|uniref:hypothetical protein n=1 Tax=Nocardioides sp. C4-1 TaxID=3151851 RepID=UPI0032651707
MSAPLDSFETALLSRLREQVDQRPDVRPRTPRLRLGLGAAVAVGSAAVMVVVLPGLGNTAAFSVQQGNTGTITVEVQRLEDASGLETELARFGVEAEITYLPDRQECAPGRYVPVKRRLSGMSVSMGSTRLIVTLPPDTIRSGETFVMAVSGAGDGSGGFAGWTEFDVTAGPVRPCAVLSRFLN